MGDSAGEAETLMRNIASDGCYYNVDNAANLKFFFGDIADQINGQGYIYVRIACPVDVTVEYNGEVLCSEEETTNTRTSFGSLTFEENIDEEDSDYYDDDVESDNRIKILRLKDGVDYNIKIEGNGYGRMNYTIGFTDSEGQYSDMREFRSIKIKDETVIDTIATKADTTTLSVDENGDGEYDYIYEAGANGTGQLVEPTDWTTIIIVGIVCITIVVIFVYFKKKKSNVTAQ